MSKCIAILATNGFEEIELTSPRKALTNEGFDVDIVSPASGKIKAWDGDHWSKEYAVDKNLEEASADQYDALFLPGGVINPDVLRVNADALKFVSEFFDDEKPVGAICHGSWTLINAEVVKNRKMTSYQSVRKDLENAGANWVDQEVVVDGNLITSRSPDDLEALNSKITEKFKAGPHELSKT